MATFSKIAEAGGYDYTSFCRRPAIKRLRLSDLSTLVAREAHQVSCCGKIFCKIWLEKMKEVSNGYDCPNCRSRLAGNSFLDKRTNREINQLRVHCDNRKEGCPWEGYLQQAQEHCKSCSERIVVCSNKCGKRMKPQQLQEHLQISMVTIWSPAYPEVEVSCPNQSCAHHASQEENGLPSCQMSQGKYPL